MLGYLGDDVVTTHLRRESCTTNCQCIALGAATCKNNFRGCAGKQLSYLLPRHAYSLSRCMGIVVSARRIAKVLREIRKHGIDDSWINRRRRVIIEINRAAL